jgi:hypothetical protein
MEFAFLGKTPRNGISSRKRGQVKMGSTAQAARWLAQSLSALGCFSKTLRRICRWYTATTTVLMRVPYRRFPIRTSRNGGSFSAPVSSRISSQIAQNAAISREKPGTAFCLPKSALPARADGVSLAGHLQIRTCRPRGCAVCVPRHYSATLW